MIRQFLEDGLNVEDMARELTALYRDSSSKVRYYLGKLLSSVYDFTAQDIATLCAELFDIKKYPDLTVSESIYISDYEESETLYWRNTFTDEVTYWEPLVSPFPEEKNPMVIDPAYVGNVLTVDSEDDIYVLRDKDNGIHLFTVEEGEEDILIDEQCFESTPAYYYTATQYFVSPVFRVKRAKQILEYCLKAIGYPYIPVRMTVVFTARKTNLLNSEDFLPGGIFEDSWKGVNVILQKQILPEPVFNNARNFMGGGFDPDSIHGSLYAGMLHSVAATSILYGALRTEAGNYPPLTSKLLAAQCHKSDIFHKPNNKLPF